MPSLPKLIRVERHGRQATIHVDGEEIPWYVADEPIDIQVHTDGIGNIRLTLLAERVEVIDDTYPAHINTDANTDQNTDAPQTGQGGRNL